MARCLYSRCRRDAGEGAYCPLHKNLIQATEEKSQTLPQKRVEEWSLPLYPYQRDDVQVMTTLLEQNRGVLNFNEMGLGKSLEAIAVVQEMGYKTVLILCPNSLRYNWKAEIEKWTGEYAAVTHTSESKKWKDWFKNPTSRWFIANYDAFRYNTPNGMRNIEIVNALKADLVILDEAHRIRTNDTKKSYGTRAILGKKFLILSGSPLVNSAADYFPLLQIIEPKRWDSYERFIRRYVYMLDTPYGSIMRGTNHAQELQTYLSTHGIQRKKKDVLQELPEKIFNVVQLDMDTTQRNIYESMENELFVELESGLQLSAPNVLASLIRLRQLCLEPKVIGVRASSAKTDYLLDFIENDLQEESLVVFSCFERYVDFLAKKFDDLGYKYVRITGKETVEKRQENVQLFQLGKVQFILGTVQAMGEGLTLTRASKVFLMDRWWSDAPNNQAIDRLHRIGQQNNVEVFIPVVTDSIDDKLTEILRAKGKYAQELQITNEVILSRMREKGRRLQVVK